MARRTLRAVGSVAVMLVFALPLGYQYHAKTTLEEQAPPLIESWLMKAFPGEYESGAVKGVNTYWTFRQEVPLPTAVMSKTGSIRQVCVTFRRESLLGNWFAVGECVPAASD